MNSGKIFMSAVMLAIFVVMVGIASQYPPQARFMPLVVGIPGVALCLLQLFLEFRASRRPRASAPTGIRSELEKVPVQSGLLKAGETRREIVLWACFIGLVGSLILFGFWVTIPVFLAVFLRYYAEKSWRYSLGLGAAATALLFLVFHKALGVVLHGGFITDYLLDRFPTQ